jgi:hypothetical protein
MHEFERLEELSLSSAIIYRTYKIWEHDDHMLDTLLGPRVRVSELDMTFGDEQRTATFYGLLRKKRTGYVPWHT